MKCTIEEFKELQNFIQNNDYLKQIIDVDKLLISMVSNTSKYNIDTNLKIIKLLVKNCANIHTCNDFILKYSKEYGPIELKNYINSQLNLEKFKKYYYKIVKYVSKENIYFDDKYANKLNYFIKDDNYDDDIKYQLDVIVADMYQHYDKESLVPEFSLLVVSEKLIKQHDFELAYKVLNLKCQDKMKWALSEIEKCNLTIGEHEYLRSIADSHGNIDILTLFNHNKDRFIFDYLPNMNINIANVVKFLSDNDICIFDREYLLFWASMKGYLEVVELLVTKVGNLHKLYPNIVGIASTYGHLDIVKLLYDNGANCESGIIRASEKGHLAIVKYLVEQGINSHVHNERALRLTLINNHLDVAYFLIENDVNIVELLYDTKIKYKGWL